MRVLIACEFSGVVRDAFAAKGHDAWSADLLQTEAPGQHITGDCVAAIKQGWDLIIMHPPCTALAVSGNRWYGTGMPKNKERHSAIDWTVSLWNLAKLNAKQVCMENPVGVLPIKPTQYIQPWFFGHSETKKTGLWLHGLDQLAPTNILTKPECGFWDNQTPSGQNKLGPSPDRWKLRSVTYSGIAQAMADQWGSK